MSVRDRIKAAVETTVTNFVYYDREKSEDLPEGKIEEAVGRGDVTVEEIVEMFATCIRREFPQG
jgi:hypothetical protein